MRRMRWLPALGWCLVLTGVAVDRGSAQTGPSAPPGSVSSGVGSQTGLVPAGAAPTTGDPYKGMRVTPEAGAWLVCVASFSGPESPDFARQMVACIRNTHHLPAYVCDYADQERCRENAAELQKMEQIPGYRPHATRVELHCAILVGGYPTADAANAALKDIKKWPPPTDIRLPSGRIPFPSKYDVVMDKEGKPDHADRILINPFMTAFVIRNPVSPLTQPAAKPKFDPAWPRMNSAEDYSIYGCHKPWTLVITQYNCYSATQRASDSPSMLEKLWNSAHARNEQLDVAAVNAHELAKFLRQCNLEAYVLHTRNSSIVTVGGFTQPNDPNMKSAKQQIFAVRRQIEERSPKKDLVQFFSDPVPMEVPH